MNFTTIIIGILSTCYGIYVWILRIKKKNESLKKFELMKKQWGEKKGIFIHTLVYIVIPVFFGIIITIAGFRGFNFF